MEKHRPISLDPEKASMAYYMERAMEKKLTPAEFVVRAINKLEKPPWKGIHVVYSGFNDAFRKYFSAEKLDPVVEVEKLSKAGVIVIGEKPTKGGPRIYKAGDGPKAGRTQATLDKILEP